MTHTLSTGLDALLNHAAIAPLDSVGWLRVTGEDRVRWLNGMVTNSITALQPGEGCFNFFLNAQGRIQGEATAYLQPNEILLETAADRLPVLTALLDRFIIMDDVELQPLEHRAGLLLAGPAAEALLTALELPAAAQFQIIDWQAQPLTIIRAHSPLIPRFELWSDAPTIGLLSATLQQIPCPIHPGTIGMSGSATTPPQATPTDLEHLRLLEGTPVYGTDIREKELPQETAQDRALHFSKGCYLGQEIVERIHSRGQVHRTFSGFLLAGAVPVPGTPITVDEKSVGEITSAAVIPLAAGPVTLALGYIRREALNANLVYTGGTATPIQLPYRPG